MVGIIEMTKIGYTVNKQQDTIEQDSPFQYCTTKMIYYVFNYSQIKQRRMVWFYIDFNNMINKILYA